MNALVRTAALAALLSTPAVALADDDALVVDPSMRPPPPPPQQNPAQPPPPAGPKRTWFGGDLAVVIPLGDYADGSDFAAGLMLRLDYVATPQVDLSIRAGYLWHKTDQPTGTSGGDYSLAMLPLLVGGEFKVGGGAFLYGEAGLTVIQVSVSIMGFSASDSKTYLSVGGGAGFRADRLKGKVGFYMPGRPESGDTGDRTTLYGVLGTIGYDFAAL